MTSTVAPSLSQRPAQPLAVTPMTRATYASVFRHKRALLRSVGPWFAVVAALGIAQALRGHFHGFDSEHAIWLSRLANVATGLGGLFIAVNWNRTVLLRLGVPQAPIFSLRALRFMAMLLVVAALVALFGYLAVGSLALLGNVRAVPPIHLGLMLLIALMFAAARLLPTLALASIDYPGSELFAALRLTRGYSLPLFQGIFCAAVPALIARGVMQLVAFIIGGKLAATLFGILGALFMFLAVVLATSYAALAFIQLRSVQVRA